jgi:hypothetical protein
MTLLNGVELPALEEGAAGKKLLVCILLSITTRIYLRHDFTPGQSGRED